MLQLYKRINSDVGVSQSFIKSKILPDWWNDDAAMNPSALAEAKIFIARGIGLDYQSLDETSARVQFVECGATKFKRTSTTLESDLSASKTIAWKTLEVACAATKSPAESLSNKRPTEIRKEILSDGQKCVNLSNLLKWCWSRGITTIHLGVLPTSVKKMDGLAARIEGRDGIVISRNQRCSSWLLFILAHELGHLALGHLAINGLLVDEHLGPGNTDLEEQQATVFATELLTGHDHISFTAPIRITGEELAKWCLSTGKEMLIEPGVLALMYAYQEDFIQVGVKAANIIAPKDDAPGQLRSAATENLDAELVGEERYSLLRRLHAVV